MGRSIPADVADTSDLLTAVARRVRRLSSIELEPLGLTHSRWRALRLLVGADGSLRMGRLARLLEVVPRSATSLVDELEASGWVRRVPDPQDGRAILVELTPAGRAITERAGAARSRAGAAVLAVLTSDELDQLGTVLRKVLVRTGSESSSP